VMVQHGEPVRCYTRPKGAQARQ